MPAKKEKKTKKQKKAERAEKLRLEQELLAQQQEEERKRQEELERLRREEAERQRLLREKKRKEELRRLDKERDEDVDIVEKRAIDLSKLNTEQSEQTEWKKHLKCDTLPDISNERELNTFLTEWQEYDIVEQVDNLKSNEFAMEHIQHYIADIESGYNLLQTLEDVIYDAIQQQDDEKIKYAKAKFIQMGKIAQDKLDIFTQKCLKHNFFTSAADAGLKEDADVMQYATKKHVKFGLWASSMTKVFQNTKIEIPSPICINLELPKQVAMKAKMPLSVRVLQFVHNFYSFANIGKQYECVGTVIDVQMFKLPLPPRDLHSGTNSGKENEDRNHWMVQHVTEETIRPIKWEYANADEPDIKSAESVTISCEIPSYILLPDSDNVMLGWWDIKRNEWKTSHFKDIAFDTKQRILSFVTCHLSPICIVQPRGAYSEYLDWKLSPSGFTERCKISLIAKCNKLNIDIEVIGGQCKLLAPHIPELKHVYDKLMKPHQLIRMLKASGINLCAKNDANVSETYLDKDETIESLVHLELSSIAALFQLSMSKWNKSVQNENIFIFRLRKPLTANEEADLQQNKDASGDDDEMWQTVMIDHEKCTFIDCNEKSDELNMKTPNRELSHKTLLRCLTSHCTEDNLRDLQNTSFRFTETLRRMLNLINVFRS